MFIEIYNSTKKV